MSGNRRDRFEVINDILLEAMNGANKTRIMQGANLNHLRFNKYFSKLLKVGVLKREHDSDGRIIYRTTEKGVNLVNTINRAESIMSI